MRHVRGVDGRGRGCSGALFYSRRSKGARRVGRQGGSAPFVSAKMFQGGVVGGGGGMVCGSIQPVQDTPSRFLEREDRTVEARLN